MTDTLDMVRMMQEQVQEPETFERYLERTLTDSGLRSYGHNEFEQVAEEACYRRARDCFGLAQAGPRSAPLGDDCPSWGIHSPEGEDAVPEAPPGEDGGINPKDNAALDKVPMWSLPAIGAVHGAMSTADGISKGYGAYNWREKSISMMGHIGALERHIAALKDGEDFTRDSNVTHLGCLVAGASIILDAQQCGTLIDDRPPPGLTTSADTLEDYHGRNTES